MSLFSGGNDAMTDEFFNNLNNDMKGLPVQSTARPSVFAFGANNHVTSQGPQVDYATLVFDQIPVGNDVIGSTAGVKFPSPGVVTLLRTSSHSDSSSSRERPTGPSTTVKAEEDEAPRHEHGNSVVGLYLVMGEGAVLILWLVLFTSIVCYSQYRKYHIAKKRARRRMAAAAGNIGSGAIPLPLFNTTKQSTDFPADEETTGRSLQPATCYSNLHYTSPSYLNPSQPLLVNLTEISSASSTNSQELRLQRDNT